jgi:hypothetical protein
VIFTARDVRAALRAGCCGDALSLAKRALSKLASRTPDAPEPSSQQPGPTGRGSPSTVTSSARAVRVALGSRCYFLSLAKLVLSKLAYWAPDTREPVLLFKSAAWPDWPWLDP